MANYNLTGSQKDMLRRIVESLNSGEASEPLITTLTHNSGASIIGVGNFGRNMYGDLEALCDEDLMSCRLNSKGNKMYSVKQKGYDAVKNDFAIFEEIKNAPSTVGVQIQTMTGGNIQGVGSINKSEVTQIQNDPKLLEGKLDTLESQLLTSTPQNQLKSINSGQEQGNKKILRKKISGFLGRSEWNGVAAIIAIFTFLLTFGFGGYILALFLGFVSILQEMRLWFIKLYCVPRYALIIGGIFAVLYITIWIQRMWDSRKKSSSSFKILKSKKNGTKYLSIPIQPGLGNSYLRDRYIINTPKGEFDWGGVKFQFGEEALILDTNKTIHYSSKLEDGSKEIEFSLPKTVNNVKAVYLLINSANSKAIYRNKKIGEIRLEFKDAPPINVEIILGDNIREWCPGNSGEYIRTTTSPDIKEVWLGLNKDGAQAVIDCLKIPVYESMQSAYLEKIVFVHKPTSHETDTMGVHYSVFGISIEMQDSN